MDWRRFWVVGALVLGLAGCASLPRSTTSPHLAASGPVGECARWFRAVDAVVADAGVRDAGSFRIPGFPYLRTDRFLASFAAEVESVSRLRAWVAHLRELDRRGRAAELANLPAAAHAALGDEPYVRLEHCAAVLMEHDLAQGSRREELRRVVVAPDEYLALNRLLGLYPLTRQFVLMRVHDWQREARRRFGYARPTFAHAHLYAPESGPARQAARDLLARAPRDALGVPVLDAGARAALLQAFAPVWEVEAGGEFDRIGRPRWREDGLPTVDPERVEVFSRISYTRFGDQVLLQLNYLVWFSERPRFSSWDLYGGLLDGVLLRVTLDGQGRPLLYDSIHACGCYHRFFPSGRLRTLNVRGGEPPLVHGTVPELGDDERIVLALASGTHYVRGLYATTEVASAERYRLNDYSTLQSLPWPGGGRRSLFGEDGIVAGTDRLERWVLWPMGVAEPGAMRQWGRHAVAFAGKRHFDDPDLLPRLFEWSGRAEVDDE